MILDDGLLKVTLRIGQKGQPGGQARASAILNIEVLCELIGVRLLSPGKLSHLV